MGLMQSAYETYEAMAAQYAGKYVENTEVLAPVSHVITRADIQITLDLEGKFLGASAIDKDAPKIIIPVTEKSAGRSGTKPVPHPLCDQIKYLSGEEQDKWELYVHQLAEWAEASDHPTLRAVLAYVKGRSLVSDLTQADLIQRSEKGLIKNDSALICWRVEGSPTPDCWRDQTLFDSFARFYEDQHKKDQTAICNEGQRKEGQTSICMINGRQTRIASQHPKGVVALNGNAKLISANDTSGFTYRGRFVDADQALTVGYEASQKAHAALRWLVANQGVSFGGRMFVCWNPQGIEMPRIDCPLLFREEEVSREPSDYIDRLRDTLKGWQARLPSEAGVVIASFDAATTGRLALTYYNELRACDLLDRLYAWDRVCCWWNGPYGVQSPALYSIANFAFGSRRDDKRIESDDKVLRQHMQRLIACRTEQAPIPWDLVRGLTERCQSLQLYDNGLREKLLSTACAVIRKYHADKKEEWNLALEPERKDRSYQYGRLLAVLEKAEQDTYDRDEKRLTNAIRLQPMYVRRPQHTFTVVLEQLKRAYYPRLHPGMRTRYEQLIGEILSAISECPPDTKDGSLTDVYLLGYYLQKKELYTKQEKNIQEEEEQ